MAEDLRKLYDGVSSQLDVGEIDTVLPDMNLYARISPSLFPDIVNLMPYMNRIRLCTDGLLGFKNCSITDEKTIDRVWYLFAPKQDRQD